jgi:hypothetical protein
MPSKPSSLSVLIGLQFLAGCARTSEPKVVTKIETRTIEVPPSLLKCMPEPQAREAWTSQRQVALYLVRLSEAGQDCRLKLEAVRKLLASQ